MNERRWWLAVTALNLLAFALFLGNSRWGAVPCLIAAVMAAVAVGRRW